MSGRERMSEKPVMTGHFAPADLSNLCEGALERQFQDALAELSAILENAEDFERSKDEVLRCGVHLEIELERQGDDAAVSVSVRARIKRPKRKRVSRTIFYSAGTFSTPLLKQGPLFDA